MCCVVGKKLLHIFSALLNAPQSIYSPNALPLLTYKSILPYIYIFVKLFYILIKNLIIIYH